MVTTSVGLSRGSAHCVPQGWIAGLLSLVAISREVAQARRGGFAAMEIPYDFVSRRVFEGL